MQLIIILFVAWIFVPLILLSIVSGLCILLPNQKKNIMKITKYFFGFKNIKEKNILLQKSKMDCGEVALKNALTLLDVKYDDFSMLEPATGEDIKKVAKNYGVNAVGYENIDIAFINNMVRNGEKVLILFKINYLFQVWWLSPTRWFFKYLVGELEGYHWSTIHSVDDKYIYVIDPFLGMINMKHLTLIRSCNGVAVALKKDREELRENCFTSE